MPQSVKRGRSKILIAMETFRSEEFKKAVWVQLINQSGLPEIKKSRQERSAVERGLGIETGKNFCFVKFFIKMMCSYLIEFLKSGNVFNLNLRRVPSQLLEKKKLTLLEIWLLAKLLKDKSLTREWMCAKHWTRHAWSRIKSCLVDLQKV